jgi:nucleoside-diphosphate-sugar epimerase
VPTSPDGGGPGGERVLVTGAAGFIGSQLARRLLALGHEPIGIVRPGGDLWRLQDLGDSVALQSLTLVGADLRELRADAIEGGVSVVYHLGATGLDPAAADPATVLETNVLGTMRALEAAKALGARRFVYCGSCFEYGPGSRLAEDALLDPVSEYGVSKLASAALARAFGRANRLEIVCLRPFTVYGPLEAPYRLVPYSIRRALTGAPLELTGGEQKRDFVYVADVVEGLVAAAKTDGVGGQTLNLCSGAETSVRELAELAVELAGTGAEIRLGALPYRDREISLSGDPGKAAALAGWRAETSLRDGLAKTIEWFRANEALYAEREKERR